MSKLTKITIAILLISAVVSFGGCSKKGSDSDRGKGAFVKVENQTGKEIIALQIKKSGEDNYGDSLVGKNTIKDGKTARIKFRDKDFTKKEKKDKYDIQLTCSDGTVFTLSAVVLPDVKGLMTIKSEGGVTYVEYKSKSDDKSRSTKDEELKIKAEAEAAAQQEAAQQAAAQGSPAAEQSGGGSGASNSGTASGASGGGTDNQNCVDPDNPDNYY